MNKQIDSHLLPEHIAIIMDGNGRWATQQGMPRSKGHVAGVEALRRTVTNAAQLGIKYLTVYAFSSENWLRPTDEVNALMDLIALSLESYGEEFCSKGVCIKVIGDLSRLPEVTRTKVQAAIDKTANNDTITLIVGLSYSSRWELNNAVHRIVADLQQGQVTPEQLLTNEVVLESYLATAGIPDPDLLIRTGGELRISNFLMYQLAYAELFFSDTLWPDFDIQDLKNALDSFAQRNRRFGRVNTEDSNNDNTHSI